MDTKAVKLTLEETGVLCHVLLPAIVAMQRASSMPKNMLGFGGYTVAEIARMCVLYNKLCDANDDLMGKPRDLENRLSA